MEIQQFITPFRRWWWLVLAATLVAAASSYIVVSRQAPLYTARTKLMIGRAINNPNPDTGDFVASIQLGKTYSEIARTQNVRQAAMAVLGMNWLPRYDVQTLNQTDLMEIIVTDAVPERAQAVANELANQLILQSPTASRPEEQARQDFIDGELDDLQTRIIETKAEIALKQDELKELISARQIQTVQAEVNSLQGKLNTLQSNYGALLANTQSGAKNSLSVIDPATLPTNPIGANGSTAVLTAAAVGFIVATAAAFLLEYLDNTVKTPDEVERYTGLPTLAGIARIQDEDQGNSEYTLMAVAHPRSPISEAYRVLRTGIQFANLDNPSNTVLVTSPKPAEGKSNTVANLAVVMAQAGPRVLVIDSDLRRPVQHKVFQLNQEPGLTNLMLSLEPEAIGDLDKYDDIVANYIQPTTVDGLDVLTAGQIPPNPSELLGSSKMKALLSHLSSQYDVILLDSPPVLAVTDAVVIATQTDSVLLVTSAGKTRHQQLTQAVEQLREVNAHLIGVTLNRLSRRSDAYGYYYYYQTSYYYYGEREADKKEARKGVFANGRNPLRRRARSAEKSE